MSDNDEITGIILSGGLSRRMGQHKAFMKINDYLSTTLIIQALYDDNAIKKIQLREVFGLAFVIDIMEIPNVI